jgi:hypothetical protein
VRTRKWLKSSNDGGLPEFIDGLPNICGSEQFVEQIVRQHRGGRVFPAENGLDFSQIRSAAAIALHMHQSLTAPGTADLQSAAIISNLHYMVENPQIGDNHNAPVFHWCYKRMGEFIPQLAGEGKQPRVMQDYSGTLLHGLAPNGPPRRLR